MKNAFKFLLSILQGGVLRALKSWFPPVVLPLLLIKEGVENPKFDLMAALTKSGVDKKILSKLRSVARLLDPSLKELKGNDTVLKFAENLRDKPKELKDAFLFKVGSSLLKESAKINGGKKIRSSEADTLFQLGFSKLKLKPNAFHSPVFEKIKAEVDEANELGKK